jgi:hypothetical protein
LRPGYGPRQRRQVHAMLGGWLRIENRLLGVLMRFIIDSGDTLFVHSDRYFRMGLILAFSVDLILPFAHFHERFVKLAHQRLETGLQLGFAPHLAHDFTETLYTFRNRVR